MGKLEGRVALITGAGDGIGRGMAECFAQEGAAVLIAEFNKETGAAAAEAIRAAGGHTDVSVPDQIIAAVAQAGKEYGGVNILVD